MKKPDTSLTGRRGPGGADAARPVPYEPLSSVLKASLDVNGDGYVTVGEVLDRVAERGFGMLLLLFALPVMIPVLPPGTGAIAGLLYMLIGFQMLRGQHRPWLPRRARNYRLSPRVVKALRQKGVSVLKRIERFSRPRGALTAQQVVVRLAAVLVMALGLVLFAPLPFMNTLPAFALMLVGIGLINRDSVFLAAGLAICVAVLTVVGFGAHLLVQAMDAVRGFLF